MSDFGPPPGPSGPPGPPLAATGSHTAAAPAGAPTGAAQQVAILTYAAAALGLLSFIWGFLDWFGSDAVGVSGYSAASGPAGAIVGLALVAGLLAAAATFEKKELGVGPAAIAVAGLLVAFGVLVGHGDAADTKIGFILAFVTAIVQAAVLVVAWLLATGKLAAFGGGGSSSNPPSQWQQGPGPQGPDPQGPGQFGGYGGQQGQFGPPPGYGAPPQESAPSYGPPPGPPSYGPPTQDAAPSYGPPSGYGPPPSVPQPFSPQPSPPATNEDDASRTQVLPRFQPDQNSTQQGIPIFDPQSRPDERPAERPADRPAERPGGEPPSYGR